MATALLYLAVAVGMLLVCHAPWPSPWPAPRLGPAVVLLALPLALVGPALLTDRVYAPLDLIFDHEPLRSAAPDGFVEPHATTALDVALQIVPWHAAVRAAWDVGDWPLWNPSMLAGDTLAASAQAAPFHPLNLLALLVPLGPACTFLAAISLFLAALGTFLWLSELGCGEWPALVGAAAYAFSGFVVFWLLWPMGLTAAHLPWVLWAVTHLVRWREPATSLVLGFVLTLTLLAGHPETALHAILAGCVVGVFELTMLARRDGVAAARRPFLSAVSAGVIALGLSALFLLPIVDALDQSAQWQGRQAGFADADHSAPLRQAVARARTAAVPFVYGLPWDESPPTGDPWFVPASSAYIGAVLLPAVLLGVARSTAPSRFLLLAFAAFGVAAGATFPGVTELLGKIPLVDLSIHKRWVMVGAVGLAGLAGLGADALRRGVATRRDGLIAHGSVLVLLAAMVAVSRPAMATRLSDGFLLVQSAWLLVPVALAMLAVGRWRGTPVVTALLALLVVQRIGEAGDRFPTLDPSWVYPEVAILEAIPDPELGEPPGRFVATGDLMPPNLASAYGLADVRGYQPLALGRYVDTFPLWTDRGDAWFHRVDDLAAHQTWLDLLGVRWALTDGPIPPGWSERTTTSTIDGRLLRLLENPAALPRAFTPRAVRLDAPADERRRALRHADDLGRVGWIERDPPGPPAGFHNRTGPVAIESLGATHVLRTAFDDPAWVVVTEPAWRGWRAVLRGTEGDEPIPVHRAQHAFLAIEVPAGEQTIVLRYEPKSFVVGRRITCGTLIALLVLAVVGWRRWW